MPTLEGMFGPVIHSYTRAQAIEDGGLADVSAGAREAGIRFPVAVTLAVWDECCAVPEGCEGLQDVDGRLGDVVWMLSLAIRRSSGGSRVDYALRCVVGRSKTGRLKGKTVRLKALCGPGDNAEPAITVMLPDEDRSFTHGPPGSQASGASPSADGPTLCEDTFLAHRGAL